MKKCPMCSKNHADSHPHFSLKNKISDKGFPTHSPKYAEAHRKANKAEEKKFGKKSFKELEKIDRKVSKHELVGKNSKTGKLEVSKKVPPKYRGEVAYHEKKENGFLKKKK